MLRWLTAGESHGQALVVVLEGLPAGLPLTVDDIQSELARRRLGYGRGPRQRFEQDELTLVGGVRHGRTLGSPLAIIHKRRDPDVPNEAKVLEVVGDVKDRICVVVDDMIDTGGTIVKELGLPFPNVEFQALLTEIASLKPDAVACFFSGGGASKFIRDYAAAGLAGKIPLYGSGFLTEGLLDDELAPAAQGIVTTLHYSSSLATKRNESFRLAYAKMFKMQPDVYAVQGYDAGQLLLQGAAAVNGDFSQKKALYTAMENAVIDSPRGKWTMSKSHNPVQDIYLRVVENKENKVVGVAAKALADSGAGCRMT